MKDNATFEPITSPLEAKSCLLGDSIIAERQSNDQKMKGLAHYLEREAPKALAAYSEFLERQHKKGLSECLPEADPVPHVEDECEIDETDIAVEAAKQGITPVMASYLRDLGDFLRILGRTIDPDGKTQLRLELKQRNRGKPTDEYAKMLHDSKIRSRVKRALRTYPKLEAAVAHVAEELGISRATVFRALDGAK